MVRSAVTWNVALSPPYTITPDEIDKALNRLACVLDAETPAFAEAARTASQEPAQDPAKTASMGSGG